jgi:hypothetical protein
MAKRVFLAPETKTLTLPPGLPPSGHKPLLPRLQDGQAGSLKPSPNAIADASLSPIDDHGLASFATFALAWPHKILTQSQNPGVRLGIIFFCHFQ